MSAAGKNILYPRKYLLVSNCNIANYDCDFDSSVINVLDVQVRVCVCPSVSYDDGLGDNNRASESGAEPKY